MKTTYDGGVRVDTSSFGSLLKARRKELDLSRELLAEHVGCLVEMIRKVEVNQRRPSRELAQRLAQCLSLSPEETNIFIKSARQPLHNKTQPYTKTSVYSSIMDQDPILSINENAPTIRQHTVPISNPHIENIPLSRLMIYTKVKSYRSNRNYYVVVLVLLTIMIPVILIGSTNIINHIFTLANIRTIAYPLTNSILPGTQTQSQITGLPTDIPTSRNLIKNSDFSDSAQFWNGSKLVGIDPCCAYNTGDIPNGANFSAYARPDGTDDVPGTIGLWQDIPNPVQGYYTVGGWVKTSDQYQEVLIQADNGDPANTPPYCMTPWIQTMIWHYIECSFELTNPRKLHVALVASNTQNTQHGWVAWDNIVLYRHEVLE
ncbi:MAG: hypothetical protein GFH27_549291n300 [Chloroflexi bacterium AL-W]|nr:hypothetical protein [Chloroflexi bacterium AL-N1]NOK67232.1 hypothetical protein [Chloroflexi bacterium AL-N10]NOK75274.1 hypothetical protein [Chloroflexi bacterium AL-N5]NOK82062.1 hypothetical protein [Chloroflexi bacterium AL-W]NOK89907.1 hypothetical protein [Chloroflexi bacterium AL-N15]